MVTITTAQVLKVGASRDETKTQAKPKKHMALQDPAVRPVRLRFIRFCFPPNM